MPGNQPLLSTELLAYYRWVSSQPLTVVDLETTGSSPHRNRAIEVSVLQGNLATGIQHQQTHLLNPEVEVPWQITQFTGISQEMVDRAALAAEVWPEYLPLLNTGILTAHNLSFDYGFLRSEYRYLEISFDRPVTEQLCTVQLSRLLLSDLPSRKLPALVRHFNFDVGRSHRAAADTLACWLLAEKLLTEIQNQSDQVLLGYFAKQWLDLQQVAAIFQQTTADTQTILEQSDVLARPVRSGTAILYQRGAVEQVYGACVGEREP